MNKDIKYKTELLAPAKNKETAIAAIDCGADAVYIGASSFGARRNAFNSLEDIREVVQYAHKFWVKVFVTVNTILTENELEEAVELVKRLDEIGVDAIIVQDMGLVEKLMNLKECKIPIHISTQADNRDVQKISFFNKLGVSRVVLARELSLKKIAEIHKANPTLELECFCHGALCVSYSGQCYLSQFIGGRSANRGECAQPCRKKYTVETIDGKVLAKDIHALCLKDFNTSKILEDMVKAGVYSFKIEGRLKEIGYVKNITAFYRQELDKISTKSSSGISTYSFIPNPEKSFNRDFTDYFLENRKDCFNFDSPKSKGEFIGKIVDIKNGKFKISTKVKLTAQDGLTDGVNGILINKIENGYIYPNKQCPFKVGAKIFRNQDVEFEKMLAQKCKRQIGVSLELIGRNIIVTDENNIQVKYEIPVGEKAKNAEKMKETFIKQISKTGDSDFYIEKINIKSETPFLPVSIINEIRRNVFEQLCLKRLKSYKREIQKPLVYTSFCKQEVDYRANVHNSFAEKFYNKCGCNVLEKSMESELPNRKIELMRTKHCIKYALNMCKTPLKLVLKDEYGKIYPLGFDCKNCEMIVFNE